MNEFHISLVIENHCLKTQTRQIIHSFMISINISLKKKDFDEHSLKKAHHSPVQFVFSLITCNDCICLYITPQRTTNFENKSLWHSHEKSAVWRKTGDSSFSGFDRYNLCFV